MKWDDDDDEGPIAMQWWKNAYLPITSKRRQGRGTGRFKLERCLVYLLYVVCWVFRISDDNSFWMHRIEREQSIVLLAVQMYKYCL